MITYRQATRAELDTAVDWAAAEGWNPGLADADAFWATDPNGFVCAEQGGAVIATGSIVSYAGAFGFMGFFIVRPDLRGHGIGRAFWPWRRDTLRARLQPGAAIGMDGVFTMQPFYARGGFAFTHRNLRMGGTGRPAPADPALRELSALPFAAVAACDRRHFGFARDEFLRRWIAPAGGRGLAALDGNTIRGLGVIRPCRHGCKIGPLFADDADTAERLFVALSAHAAGQPLFLDTPENNPAALALAARHGLTEVFGCARMYHGAAPALPWQNIYGVTTFELG
ncbi:MAG TPA: GNAT family N-acetyltransferase [Opitutus sp.]|nr:GNAT family N-acetyltransferase [Opitutus sp.]